MTTKLRKGRPAPFLTTPYDINIDESRNSLLTDFGLATLEDRYLLPGETPQTMFARVACAYADDRDHAQNLYDYMSQLWFMPATPILSNGGTSRGLPISCFLNTVEDSLDGIQTTWNENMWLSANGGGTGTDWSQVRSIGESVGEVGKTSGVIPFIKVMDSLTMAISQGSLRRGSAAVYLDVTHPEIEEFLEIRKPTGGDANRKSLYLHHGVNLTNKFMRAVHAGEDYELISPLNGRIIKRISARAVWQKILELRIQSGEPYLLFIDQANAALPDHLKDKGLKIRQSNLCSEIMLPTSESRTAVCCLSSLNAVHYTKWIKNEQFYYDIYRFLDNVLQDFINRAPDEMERAKVSAFRERSVGLGLMGFHSLLQNLGVEFEGVTAKSLNRMLFKNIKHYSDEVNIRLGQERGPCEDSESLRFSHMTAVAPTASISVICGGVSAGIEPIPGNVYTHKTLSGSFSVRNPALVEVLKSHDKNTEDVWLSILEHEGSVQQLDFLSEREKNTFKTSFELDQRWVIEHAADRTEYIDQGQSVNLFLPTDINKVDLHKLHFSAWSKGLKSLYYCRSKSIQRTAIVGKVDYEECLSCQ